MIFVYFVIAAAKLQDFFEIFIFTVSKYISKGIQSKHFAVLSIVWGLNHPIPGALESPLGPGHIGLRPTVDGTALVLLMSFGGSVNYTIDIFGSG